MTDIIYLKLFLLKFSAENVMKTKSQPWTNVNKSFFLRFMDMTFGLALSKATEGKDWLDTLSINRNKVCTETLANVALTSV